MDEWDRYDSNGNYDPWGKVAPGDKVDPFYDSHGMGGKVEYDPWWNPGNDPPNPFGEHPNAYDASNKKQKIERETKGTGRGTVNTRVSGSNSGKGKAVKSGGGCGCCLILAIVIIIAVITVNFI